MFYMFYVFFSNLYLYNTVLSVLFCVNKDIIITKIVSDNNNFTLSLCKLPTWKETC